ncbi:cysteine hydrolase family protein [Clostridium transplantifaecale]|uniref:cysteine hydrolase family protein n=1 Tax=Clostridium transplantifaecale TaxID=2479838 RepID=UPI000F62E52B|nr:isochorismatase family cysteine hydrolase [Clostridium transplantifaecale]
MKKLLAVIDMQNDFVDGSLGTEEAQAIVSGVKALIEQYRDEGQEVVFTLDTHDGGYLDTLEGKNLPVAHCIKGTKGRELCSQLNEYEGKRFEKPTFGCIGLAEYVKEGNYESVELVGLCTDICVISNALLIKAAVPNTPVSVRAGCCAGVTPESHENALKAMSMCQVGIS